MRGLYPSNGVAAGYNELVSVSPTVHSLTSLKPVATYPTCPAYKVLTGVGVGLNIPNSTISASLSEDMTRILSVSLMLPSVALTYPIMPLYESYKESNIRARKSVSVEPTGLGILSITSFKISNAPVPSFADTNKSSSSVNPKTCINSDATLSGSAWGKSILLITGINTKS